MEGCSTASAYSVSPPPGGLDDPVTQPAPQLRHVLVDRPLATGEVEAPHLVEERATREDPAGVRCHESEEVELASREVHAHAVPLDLCSAHIYGNLAHLMDLAQVQPPRHRP